MRVQTTWLIDKTPEQLWPLLCDSKMDTRRPFAFRLGVPKPVECRLPDGPGGVGQRRQCVSETGTVQQRITHWEPPHVLRFSMVDSTLFFRPCVNEIHEEFQLEAIGAAQTRITRTTMFSVHGVCAWGKGVLMCLGLKRVHKYVFANWAAL